MPSLLIYFLIFGLVAGELIKLPLLAFQVGTLLDVIVGALCLIGLFNLHFKLKQPSLVLKLSLGFIALCVISLLFTPLHLSVSQYLLSFSYTLRWGIYVLLGWIIYSGGLYPINKYAQEIFIFSGILLSILGFLQLIFVPNLAFLQPLGWDPHYLRLVSTFLDPNFLGAYLGCILVIVALYRSSGSLLGIALPRKLSRKMKLLSFLLVYLADVLTFSRSALLMFVVSFLILSWLKRSIKFFVLTIMLTVVFGVAYLGYNQIIANMRHINRTQSAALRVSSWHLGVELIKKYPVLGVGFNSYRYGLFQNHMAPNYYVFGHGGSSNDSSLIFVASTTGIIGLIFYSLFLLGVLKTGWKSSLQGGSAGEVILAGLGGLMVNSLFINSLFYPWILLWIFVMSSQTSIVGNNTSLPVSKDQKK